MKYLSILAVASLALSPALATAQSSNSDNNKPKPGPLAGRALQGGGSMAGPATAVLGLLVAGGVIMALGGSSDANNKTNEVPK